MNPYDRGGLVVTLAAPVDDYEFDAFIQDSVRVEKVRVVSAERYRELERELAEANACERGNFDRAEYNHMVASVLREDVKKLEADKRELVAVLKEAAPLLDYVAAVGLEALEVSKRVPGIQDRVAAAISKAESTN